MLFKNHKFYIVNLALVLALLGGMFGVVQTQARGEVYDPISNEGFLNPDGTLKLDDGASASLNLQGWDVQLDPVRGPVFSPKNSVESVSSFAQSTPGEWSALGSNLAGNDGAINYGVDAVAVSGTNVYVGGGFTDAGGIATADYIAKWDGANWSALGSNGAGDGSVNNFVSTIVVNGSDVYVGGDFTNVNNNGMTLSAADYIAKWNGSSWSALGSNGAGDGSLNNSVIGITGSGNTIYVGGTFQNVNNNGTILTAADYVAKFDGTNWSSLGSNGSANGALNDVVADLALSGSNLYVGGGFTNVNNAGTTLTAADYIAKWDGTNWSAVGSNGAGDGSLNNVVLAVAASNGNVYAGGWFYDVNSNGTVVTQADRIAKFDGTNWSALSQGDNGGISVAGYVQEIAVSGNDVFVGGHFGLAGSVPGANAVAKWDGTNWLALGNNGASGGSLNNDVLAIAVGNGNVVYVGGLFANVNNNGTVLWNADGIAAYQDTATITVNNLNDSGSGSLRQAIADAASGDTIIFDASLAGQTITLASTLVISKDLAIDGSALASQIAISGDDLYRVFYINSGVTVTLESLIISHGESPYGSMGGGIFSAGSLTVTDSTIAESSAAYGGGIFNEGGTLTMIDSTLSYNDAYMHGGGIDSQGGTVIVINSTLSNNNASFTGGGVYNADGSLTVSNSTFTNNSGDPFMSSYAGGIYNAGGTVTVSDSTFSNNSATASGGGIFHSSGTLTITNSIFSDNRINGYLGAGGGIINYATLIIDNSIFFGNSAERGGAIYNNGTLGMLTVTDSTFYDNSAQDGGGIFNYGTLTVTDSTFSGNGSVEHSSLGGAISNYDTATVMNSTFFQNFAYYGGGLHNWEILTVTNSTFSENEAVWGGGIANAGDGMGGVGGTLTVKNSTFSANGAQYGGGIANIFISSQNSILNYVNTIIANSTNGGDCYNVGDIGTNLNNLVEDGSCSASRSGDPKVGPLADNGGLTQTMALLADSPAINAGDDSTCPDVDQRGVTRPQDAHCDIGAYEYDGSILPTVTPTLTNTPTHTQTFTPTHTPTNTSTPTATSPTVSSPLYLSWTGNQTIGGVASADEDILRFDGTSWSLFFDGSDVGVGSSDLFGFSIVDSDTILMSFNTTLALNGISVTPRDVVQFDATSLGTNTAGTFSMYFNGIDVGLDVSAENIDSVSRLADGRVLISTTGNPAVSGVTGALDEDVLVFTPTTLGTNTSGSWSIYFDGSDVGLGETSAEDVDALDVASDGKIYLSTTGDFAVSGVSGADEDVFICTATSLGNVTACNYSSALFFDGTTWGLAANDVDAFNLSTTGSVATATQTPNASATPSPTGTQTPGGLTTTPTRTPTATRTPSPTVTQTAATSTITPTATQTSGTSDLIFADGFESGNLSSWTSNTNDSGDLLVSPSAALMGNRGLQAVIDDTNTIYVTDDSPNAEPRYRVRFYFDPNTITMASNDAHFILKGFMGTSTEVLRLEFRNSTGAYQLRAALLNDATTWTNSNWFTISDAPHSIELDWRASSGAGANNGSLTLWINGVQQAALTGVDNDALRIDRVRLGALAGMDVGTSGTYFFDTFESRRQTYIGP